MEADPIGLQMVAGGQHSATTGKLRPLAGRRGLRFPPRSLGRNDSRLPSSTLRLTWNVSKSKSGCSLCALPACCG